MHAATSVQQKKRKKHYDKGRMNPVHKTEKGLEIRKSLEILDAVTEAQRPQKLLAF